MGGVFGGKKEQKTTSYEPVPTVYSPITLANPNANAFKGIQLKRDGEMAGWVDNKDGWVDVQTFQPKGLQGLDTFRQKALWGGNQFGSYASGLEKDYLDYINQGTDRYESDLERYNKYNKTIDELLPQTSITNPLFQQQLQGVSDARYNRSADMFNRDYKDVARSTAMDYASRFGGLNNSGFSNAMDRNERNYSLGLNDIINNVEAARLQDQSGLLQMNQQSVDNYLTERNNSYAAMQNYENTIGKGLNYYNTMLAQNDPFKMLDAGTALAQQSLQNKFNEYSYMSPTVGAGSQYQPVSTYSSGGGNSSLSNAIFGGMSGAGAGLSIGSKIGAIGGPLGTAIGGGLGLVGGLFS